MTNKTLKQKFDFKESLDDLHDFLILNKQKRILLMGEEHSIKEWKPFLNKLFNTNISPSPFINIKNKPSDFYAHYVLFIIVVTTTAQLRYLSLLKVKYPQIPIVLLSDKYDIKIDQAYENGADLYFNKIHFFSEPNSKKADYSNLNEFLRKINLLLAKSIILDWLWCRSKEIRNNIEEQYANTKIAVIHNKTIRKRIVKKLLIAIGQLRKPHTRFESKFDLTNEEFAFLTYWSILNEIGADWIVGNIKSGKKLKTGVRVTKQMRNENSYPSSHTNLESFDNISCPTNSAYENQIIESVIQLGNDRFYRFNMNSYRLRTPEDFSGCKYDNYPRLRIPLILDYNEVPNRNALKAKISYLNKIRNELEYTHKQDYDIQTSGILEERDLKQAYFDCLFMIQLVYTLLNKEWNFVDGTTTLKNINYYVLIQRKLRGENIMRYKGIFDRILEKDNADRPDLFVIKSELEATKTEAFFKVRSEKIKDQVGELKKGTKILLYFEFDSGITDNKPWQFSVVKEIFTV